MTFGLTNPPAALMDLINRVSRSYLNSFFNVFLDDILVYSKNEGEHTNHLRVVLQVLNEHMFLSKYIKCEFWLRSGEFCSLIISSEGIEVDPRKRKRWKKFILALDPSGIKNLLCLASYYRWFVDGFAFIASFVTTLTKDNVKFEWSEACERSFKILKYMITSNFVLTLSEDTKSLVVYSDASQLDLVV